MNFFMSLCMYVCMYECIYHAMGGQRTPSSQKMKKIAEIEWKLWKNQAKAQQITHNIFSHTFSLFFYTNFFFRNVFSKDNLGNIHHFLWCWAPSEKCGINTYSYGWKLCSPQKNCGKLGKFGEIPKFAENWGVKNWALNTFRTWVFSNAHTKKGIGMPSSKKVKGFERQPFEVNKYA
jgi:hypothetical protein